MLAGRRLLCQIIEPASFRRVLNAAVPGIYDPSVNFSAGPLEADGVAKLEHALANQELQGS